MPCLGGERGPSNDAESLGYRVARPSVFEEILFRDLREYSLRGGIFLAGGMFLTGQGWVRRIGRFAASLFRERPAATKGGRRSPRIVRSGRCRRKKERFPCAILFQKSVYPGAEQREVVLDRIGSVERPERGGDLLDGLPVVLLSGEQSERAAHMARMHVERQIERCRGIDFHSPKSTPRPSSRTIHLRYMHKRLHEAPRSIDERCFSALGR